MAGSSRALARSRRDARDVLYLGSGRWRGPAADRGDAALPRRHGLNDARAYSRVMSKGPVCYNRAWVAEAAWRMAQYAERSYDGVPKPAGIRTRNRPGCPG